MSACSFSPWAPSKFVSLRNRCDCWSRPLQGQDGRSERLARERMQSKILDAADIVCATLSFAGRWERCEGSRHLSEIRSRAWWASLSRGIAPSPQQGEIPGVADVVCATASFGRFVRPVKLQNISRPGSPRKHTRSWQRRFRHASNVVAEPRAHVSPCCRLAPRAIPLCGLSGTESGV